MNTLEQQLIGLVEIGSNRLLALDPETEKLCAELQGQVIAIELIDVKRTLYFHPGSWGMRLSLQAPPKDVDATIRGHVLGLISLSRKQDRISTSIRERIEISGNTRVAQKFQKILTGIDIDWEEQLSKYTGDIIAYRVSQGLRNTRQWVTDNLTSFGLSGREYLQEETHQLPTRPEFLQFKQAVTSIRDDVERLEALINHKFDSRK